MSALQAKEGRDKGSAATDEHEYKDYADVGYGHGRSGISLDLA